MANQDKLLDVMQRHLPEIALSVGVSTVAAGVYLFLSRFGIIYQLLHKVYTI